MFVTKTCDGAPEQGGGLVNDSVTEHEIMRSTIRLLVLSAMVTVLSPTAAATAQALAGTWSGTVTQADYGSYPVTMVLSSNQEGTIDYPSSNCSGTLSGGPSGGSYIFTETITRGRASETTGGCVNGGTITMTMSGADSMSWEWIGAFGAQTFRVSGTLSRVRPVPAGARVDSVQPDNVTLTIRAFIPTDIPGLSLAVPAGPYQGLTMIRGPVPLVSDCFLTDNRERSTTADAHSRLSSRIALRVSASEMQVLSEEHWTDFTVELDCEDGDEECRLRAKDGRRKDDKMAFSAPRREGGFIVVSLTGAANNPCFGGSPDIDYQGSFRIDPERGEVGFEGRVDPFPDFEVLVNGRHVCVVPHRLGADPWNLPGVASREVGECRAGYR